MEPVDKIKNWIKDNTIKLPTEELRIIDVGFNQPGDFLELYHVNGLKSYNGIELISENDCHVMYNRRSVSSDMSADLYNQYTSYCNLRGFEALDRIRFYNVFDFAWETNIINYIELSNNDIGNLNLAIFSNILHKIESRSIASKVLDWYAVKSVDDSYAYLSVMADDSIHGFAGTDFKYSTEEFNNLICKWNCLAYEKTEDGFHTALLKK